MLYNLLTPLANEVPILNLFNYITFRTGGAIITSLLICFVIAQPMITWLNAKQREEQPIRNDGPETHLQKAGTPTMGGLMILISVCISTILWSDVQNLYVWYTL